MMVQDCLNRRQIAGLLERTRSALHMNESDVELIGLAGKNITIAFRGRVVESYSSIMLLKIGMELALKRDVPGFGELHIAPPGNETKSHDDL